MGLGWFPEPVWTFMTRDNLLALVVAQIPDHTACNVIIILTALPWLQRKRIDGNYAQRVIPRGC